MFEWYMLIIVSVINFLFWVIFKEVDMIEKQTGIKKDTKEDISKFYNGSYIS